MPVGPHPWMRPEIDLLINPSRHSSRPWLSTPPLPPSFRSAWRSPLLSSLFSAPGLPRSLHRRASDSVAAMMLLVLSKGHGPAAATLRRIDVQVTTVGYPQYHRYRPGPARATVTVELSSTVGQSDGRATVELRLGCSSPFICWSSQSGPQPASAALAVTVGGQTTSQWVSLRVSVMLTGTTQAASPVVH